MKGTVLQILAKICLDMFDDTVYVPFFSHVVDFVLKDPREKDDDKKEEVLEHKLE